MECQIRLLRDPLSKNLFTTLQSGTSIATPLFGFDAPVFQITSPETLNTALGDFEPQGDFLGAVSVLSGGHYTLA